MTVARTGAVVLRVAVLLALGLPLVGSLAGPPAPGPRPTVAAPTITPTAEARADYASLEAKLRRAVARKAREAQLHASWRREAGLAAALMALADLTGDYATYDRAREHLDRSFARARAGSGPHLLRARFNARMHRVSQAQDDIATVRRYAARDNEVLAAVDALDADLALATGRSVDAEARYRALVARDPSPANLARLAHSRSRSGAVDEADALYARAVVAAARDPYTAAWLELQRGLLDLDRNRDDDALAHYRVADARFGGWWLVEEHIAEIDARQGRTDKAAAAYRDLIARTGNPEFMDALAAITGDAQLRQRARAVYERRLALFPEATYGHAVEHFLGFEDGAAVGLELARKNFALRPNREARELLARALVAAGGP